MSRLIREVKATDFHDIWAFFKPIVQAEETYAFDPNIDFDTAFNIWMEAPEKTYVFCENNEILGSYYIKPNANGPGNHVSNCGYMVSKEARGKGIATDMCKHSQEVAVQLGYFAMQFNSVVSKNTKAVKLWESLGFEIVGTLPKAYKFKNESYVDSYVMYKWLK